MPETVTATLSLRIRGALSLPLGCAVYVCACAAALAGGHGGFGAGAQRATVQLGVAAVIVAGAITAATAGSARQRRFWGLLCCGLALLSGSYVASALDSLALHGPWAAVGLALLLAAYPFLFGALSSRAISEEGFEGGLATLLDVGILVCSLMVAAIPLLVVPVATQHGAVQAGGEITWASNVGLLAGGMWLLYRIPAGGELRSTGLLVVSLATFSVLTLVGVAIQLHGDTSMPWWLITLYGPPYALVALAPLVERGGAVERDRSARVSQRWLTPRVVMPYAAFLPMLVLWFVSVGLEWDNRLFGSGVAVVATLVVVRQLLLIRDHHGVLLERARQALTDELTGVRNRRAFDEDLAQLLDIAQRRDARLVVLMVDLDELKAINDTHGHIAGDRSLVAVADALGAAARTSDRVYRIGGDEFAMLLPDAEPLGAQRVLSDARMRIAGDGEGRVSVSAGMACYPGDARDAQTLLAVADGRLYGAKRARLATAPPRTAAGADVVVRLREAAVDPLG